MAMFEQIEKEKQQIARCEKSLALERLNKRRADTRHKIELGGLIIKSGLNKFNKSVILGALYHLDNIIKNDSALIDYFDSIGNQIFASKS